MPGGKSKANAEHTTSKRPRPGTPTTSASPTIPDAEAAGAAEAAREAEGCISAYNAVASRTTKGKAELFPAGPGSCWAILDAGDVLAVRGECYLTVWAGGIALGEATICATADHDLWVPSRRQLLVLPTVPAARRIVGLPQPADAALRAHDDAATGFDPCAASLRHVAGLKKRPAGCLTVVLLEPAASPAAEVVRRFYPSVFAKVPSVAAAGAATATAAAAAAAKQPASLEATPSRGGDVGVSQGCLPPTLSSTEVARTPAIVIPDEWTTAALEFAAVCPGGLRFDDAGAEPVMVVCGPKDVGKSTFVRTATNMLLQSNDTVAYLDCDLGQTEFTPAGMVSLHLVTRQVIGPPFSHQRTPANARYLGIMSPKAAPQLYLRAIFSLVDAFRRRCARQGCLPLVVNTMGWVKGLGVPLLYDIIRYIQPHSVVDLRLASSTSKNLSSIAEGLGEESLLVAGPERDALFQGRWPDAGRPSFQYRKLDPVEVATERRPSTLLSADHRAMSFMAYFMTQQPTMALVAQPTFCLRLARLHLAFVGGVVPLRHALRAINGTVVGLVASTTACVTSFDVIRDAPIAECVGQGVVRAVDVDAGLIYIIAPESEARLERVNILVRGDAQLPGQLLLQEGDQAAPYLTADFSTSKVLGRVARKTRTNLERWSLSKGAAGRP